MQFTAQQIAGLINATVQGNPETTVSSFNNIEAATKGDLTFMGNAKYSEALLQSEASIILIGKDMVPDQPLKATLLVVNDAYQAFATRVAASRQELREFADRAHREGRTLVALGASTKGNVLLQYCGLDSSAVAVVGEVNPEKYGCYTPGTWIPIRPESEVLASKPDYLVVLPWHFRTFFLGNARFAGMRLLFPLPRLEVVQVAEVGE